MNILFSCKSPSYIISSSHQFYTPGQTDAAAVDSSVIKDIQPYASQMNDSMNRKIGYAERFMEKGKPESELGNFVADLCFEMALRNYEPADNHPIDFCVLNNGGLRSSLPAGDLTVKNIFEVMPFENELVVLTLSGDSTEKLLQYISLAGGVPVSGIRMKLGGSEYRNTMIGTAKFDSRRNYKVVTSDYLADGGDSMFMLSSPVASEPIKLKIRDAIINRVVELSASGKNISALKDGRITE